MTVRGGGIASPAKATDTSRERALLAPGPSASSRNGGTAPGPARGSRRAQIRRFLRAIQDSDETAVREALVRLSRSRPLLAPAALAAGRS